VIRQTRDERTSHSARPEPVEGRASNAILDIRPPLFRRFVLVGHTDDLAVRLAQHQDGSLGGYTSQRRPVTLVHSEEFDCRDDAFQRERQIKGWSRAKKQALADGNWTRLKQLAKAAHPSTGSG